MQLHLRHRLYECIWFIWAKQTEIVDDKAIHYVVLPRYLLIGGFDSKKLFVNAMCFSYKPARKIMIFLSKRERCDSLARYTIYHEFIEASFHVNFTKETLPYWNDLAQQALFSLGDNSPIMEEILRRAKKAKQSPGHMMALLLEAALAKKELAPEALTKMLEDMLQNRT